MTKILLSVATIIGLTLTFSSAEARTSITSNQIGGTTYYNGTIGGKSYSGSSSSIGNTTFYNGSVGGQTYSGSSSSIGNTTYYNFR